MGEGLARQEYWAVVQGTPAGRADVPGGREQAAFWRGPGKSLTSRPPDREALELAVTTERPGLCRGRGSPEGVSVFAVL